MKNIIRDVESSCQALRVYMHGHVYLNIETKCNLLKGVSTPVWTNIKRNVQIPIHDSKPNTTNGKFIRFFRK